jgi:bifunctional DNA-binding transcriptional regulator/antitoxin component of YhaV-PrlF toxin-antitoxin module
MIRVALMKGFSRVDKEGRIAIRKNIRKEAGFKENKLVESKVQGTGSSRHITIRTCPHVR